jgi:hypothetical protein
MSQQDPTLNTLGLKDVRYEQLLLREERLQARGKNIRVSVKDGVRPPPETSKKKKGKK